MRPKEAIQNSPKDVKSILHKSIAILFGVIAVVAVYQVFKHYLSIDLINLLHDLFMLKNLPSLGEDSSYGILFVLGILTSVHCIGMCGGIAMSQTIGKVENLQDKRKNIKNLMLPSALYNLGRIISYTFIGGLVGGLGQVLSFNGLLKGLVPIAGGILMIVMGIKLLGIFPALRKFNIPVPSFVARKLVNQNNYTPFIVGILTGLMPCGPLQIVQLYALGTRSVLIGALSMFVFSVGTVPALLVFGMLNSFISKKNSNRILKFSAALVVVLGFVMIGRGLALSGININFMGKSNVNTDGIAKIEGNFQKVVTKVDAGSYPSIIVQKGIPVKWTITADKESLNQCNNEITIPKLNINKKLTVGENIIEFTAENEGEIVYTCWMGMIKSNIYVVSDLKQIPENITLLRDNKDNTESSSCSMSNLEGEYSPGSNSNNCNEKEACRMEKDKSGEECDKMGNNRLSAECSTTDKSVKGKGEMSDAVNHSIHEKQKVPTGEEQKKAADEIKFKTWEGYLIDKHCFEIMKPENETRACLLMEECADSGYGIAVKQNDGNYKFYMFDEKGHQLAYEQLNKLTKNSGFKVIVKGTLTENIINVYEFSVN
ncbi:sulfite exporter TauE/SafE family protein [Acetivibrio clariflavus]|uniref:Urease accessory protein UreH-like transmembrane domain-containing protein n=1 Tax=Acetivibrio clariflavus (strain DSM 19732 / NBRC 101661 / EBR45) TaxID=720554 RepID=G8LYB1_ACECE|nr:sulfite exporter TauE/SafE family protein [Acetivibrio clariflavus]AEV68880.1 hypothetical protein Clocl_2293 [Acetivibrio clariflavus DSM 19732]